MANNTAVKCGVETLQKVTCKIALRKRRAPRGCGCLADEGTDVSYSLDGVRNLSIRQDGHVCDQSVLIAVLMLEARSRTTADRPNAP